MIIVTFLSRPGCCSLLLRVPRIFRDFIFICLLMSVGMFSVNFFPAFLLRFALAMAFPCILTESFGVINDIIFLSSAKRTDEQGPRGRTIGFLCAESCIEGMAGGDFTTSWRLPVLVNPNCGRDKLWLSWWCSFMFYATCYTCHDGKTFKW